MRGKGTNILVHWCSFINIHPMQNGKKKKMPTALFPTGVRALQGTKLHAVHTRHARLCFALRCVLMSPRGVVM